MGIVYGRMNFNQPRPVTGDHANCSPSKIKQKCLEATSTVNRASSMARTVQSQQVPRRSERLRPRSDVSASPAAIGSSDLEFSLRRSARIARSGLVTGGNTRVASSRRSRAQGQTTRIRRSARLAHRGLS